jgi:uncharacterized membrane protein YgcG
MRGLRIAALAALGSAALLAGCNTTSLKNAEADCLARNATYSGAWACARAQQYAGTPDEYRARYVATGDTLLARVNAGIITDAQARTSMAGGFRDGGFASGGRGRSGGGGRR